MADGPEQPRLVIEDRDALAYWLGARRDMPDVRGVLDAIAAARRMADLVRVGDALHFDGRNGRPLVKRAGCAVYVSTGYALLAAQRAGREGAG